MAAGAQCPSTANLTVKVFKQTAQPASLLLQPSVGRGGRLCPVVTKHYRRTHLLSFSSGASPLFTPPRVNICSSRQDMPTSDLEHWFQQVVSAVECPGAEASADRSQHAARLEKIYCAILSSWQAGELQARRAWWGKGAVKMPLLLHSLSCPSILTSRLPPQ